MKLNYKKKDFKYKFFNIKTYIIIFSIFLIYSFYNINILQNKLPELNDFNRQTLNLFIPPNESYKFCQRTFFFLLNLKIKILKITLKLVKLN